MVATQIQTGRITFNQLSHLALISSSQIKEPVQMAIKFSWGTTRISNSISKIKKSVGYRAINPQATNCSLPLSPSNSKWTKHRWLQSRWNTCHSQLELQVRHRPMMISRLSPLATLSLGHLSSIDESKLTSMIAKILLQKDIFNLWKIQTKTI